VLYFRPNASWKMQQQQGSASARDVLLRQPVVVDYGDGQAWTSTSSYEQPARVNTSDEGPAPLIYSCPSIEFPGLIKYAVHSGTATTASERTYVPDCAATVEPVRRWLRKHAPFVADDPVLAETCLYTNTPDEDFVVDVLPHRPSIVVACGFSGHGFKFAPLIGQAAAGLALAGCAPFDVSPFRLSRPALAMRVVDTERDSPHTPRYKL
jgi:glycine/D-amino acid oxidase-like deaminating enzyme